MGLPERLEQLTHKALDTQEQIMDTDLPANDDRFVRLLGIKQAASATILGAQIKTDENRFRARQGDHLAQLLETVLVRKAVLDSEPEADSAA